MASKFKKLKRKAVKKGWVVPVNSVFTEDTWVKYWEAMAFSEQNPGTGRPIPPHRSGGARGVGPC